MQMSNIRFIDSLALPAIPADRVSRGDLLERYINSVNAVSHAIDVLRKNAPNARDCDADGGHHFKALMGEHLARVASLEQTLAELRKIGEHVGGLS
jgi:hypothetical protein